MFHSLIHGHVNNRRSIRMEKRPFCSCYAAMATTLKWRWRGGCSNGRTLSVCIDLTHTGTVRHALLPRHPLPTIFSPYTPKHSISQSTYCELLLPQINVSILYPRDNMQTQIAGQATVVQTRPLQVCAVHLHKNDKMIRYCCLYMTQF